MPWYTISVAAGVPTDIAVKLNKAINTVVACPDLAQRWNELGVTPLGGSPQDAEKRNAEETRLMVRGHQVRRHQSAVSGARGRRRQVSKIEGEL